MFRPFPLLLFRSSSFSRPFHVSLLSLNARYLFHSVIRVLLFHLFAYLSIPADAASLLVQLSQYGKPSAPPAELFMTDALRTVKHETSTGQKDAASKLSTVFRCLRLLFFSMLSRCCCTRPLCERRRTTTAEPGKKKLNNGDTAIGRLLRSQRSY